MLVALMLSGVLAAAGDGAAAGDRPKLALLSLRNDGVDPSVVPQVVDALAHVLSRGGRAEVLTATEIQAVMGLEASKSALACDAGSCAALDEIARAMDVRYIVAGAVAPRQAGIAVSLSVVDISSGGVVGRAAVTIADDDYQGALADSADELMAGIGGVVVDPTPPLLGLTGLALASVGALALVTGAVVLVIDDGAIRSVETSLADKDGARSRYVFDQGLIVAGAAILAAGGTLAVISFSGDGP